VHVNIDTIGNSSDDRNVQENAPPRPRTTRNPIQMRSHDCNHPASACALRIDPERTSPRFDQRITAVSGINVLVIVGSRARTLGPQLIKLAAQSSPDGIRLNVFDGLADLPPYSQTVPTQRTPDCVVALRAAAADAQAALVLTHYRGRVPAMLHNAIEWLTRSWNESSLHDKPLAVIGPSAKCYSGVWSHHQGTDGGRRSGPRIIEPITVATLADAVRKLADEANPAGAACRAVPAPEGGQ